MPIDLIRDAVKKAFPSRKWTARVNKMPDTQVAAIYTRLLAQKKI